MALYDQEVARNIGTPNCQQLNNCCKTSYRSDDEKTETSEASNDVVERGSVTKSQKGEKAYVEKKVEEVFSVEGTSTMF